MRKIVCEVCGTSYPETASACPICGSARSVDARILVDDSGDSAPETPTYTYVKGGRFSKKNVRKRNAMKNNPGRREEIPVRKAAKPRPAPTGQKAERKPVIQEPVSETVSPKPTATVNPAPEKEAAPAPQKKAAQAVRSSESQKGNGGLVAAIAVLAIIVVGLGAYLGLRQFAPEVLANIGLGTPTETATEPSMKVLPCTDLVLVDSTVTLDRLGATWKISAVPTPADTTDTVTFVSSNPDVATVTLDGQVTAVSAGTATITVTCGNVSKSCTVRCSFANASTAPSTKPSTAPSATTEVTTAPTTLPPIDLTLNRDDFTLTYAGEEWMLMDDEDAAKLVTWASDDTDVCTVKDGLVTAVGSGAAKIIATYNGKSVECWVRCSF
ncbi:MAG: Ig-like domain-containing protein [Candidatus Faecousia sp.]|nr:Ig-like domain-containing protein [Bacillota bacterium]MDY2809711.1 Ig-like domain-containing protein [Candidatus Faecousia sp.]